MKNRTSATVAIICVLSMLIVPLSILSDYSDGAQVERLMLDEGNGATDWYAIDTNGTYEEIIEKTLKANGHACTVSAGMITVDGKTSNTVGSVTKTSANVLDEPGTSGDTVSAKWIPYKWISNQKKWVEITDLSETYSSGNLAVGFYPANTVPSETPENQSVVCIGYDAKSSKTQTADLSSVSTDVKWAEKGYDGKYNGIYAQILTAGGYAFIKYGQPCSSETANTAMMVAKNIESGEIVWSFKYDRNYYENSNSVIVGDYIYIQSTTGKLFKIDWKNSTGTAVPVKTLEGIKTQLTEYPSQGMDFAEGLTSLVCDSGVLYSMASNGMIYCFDLDLNPIWSYHTGGKGYYAAPVICDDYLFAGMLDGHLYILNKNTGEKLVDLDVYHTAYKTLGEIGSVGMPAVIKDSGRYYLYFTFSDGRGMSAQAQGMALCEYDGASTVNFIKKISDSFGAINSFTAYTDESFKGVYFLGNKTLYKMDLKGSATALNSDLNVSHSYLVLVNNDTLITTSYTKGEPVCKYDLSGKLTGTYLESEDLNQFCMCGVTVINGLYMYGNDASAVCVCGGFVSTIVTPTTESGLQGWQIALISVGIIAGIIAIAYCVMRFWLKWEHPFKELILRFKVFVNGDKYSHNTLRRHRLWLILFIGILLSLTAAIVSLCVGPTSTYNPIDMFAHLFSAIGKGGNNLTYDELMVYSARLPRTLAALAIGVGLSIAGAMYQAVIRNPLVDPYIMGVSSGAGTAAIAVIAFDFTFFGLFPSHSIYLTAITAAIGGIIAFLCTMFLASKAGGSSVNYVLAGVVVGLVFSAIQTLMLTFAGTKVTGALSWLYGSFSEVTWNKVWLIVIPVLAISLSSLFWAKEFNLVLLGEDQAKQMGLNVKKFNRWMLILASILTSICVAFVGIIGFVGLVIPHLCRMMLGGDHRLVLPASMAFGGFLMVIADIAARMLIPGFELPVGAITTIIGVPVFAWLLIKRGRMYEG